MSEADRAAAFASQSDKSRALAAGHVQQALAAVQSLKALRDLITQKLAEQRVEHRWVDTRLDIMGIDGEFVIGVDLRGVRGYPGPAIELQMNAGVLSWRISETDDAWQPLVDLGSYLTDAQSAATLAGRWAEAGDTDVAGAGTRSAKHHAGLAASSASTADAAKTAAQSARDMAQDWAEKPENSAVASGQFSALHHAAKAAASAAAAATFDPAGFYTKGAADTLLDAKAPKASPGFSGTVTLPNGRTIDASTPKFESRGRSARGSNTALAFADAGWLFDLTGSFTQTFGAAASLGMGWWTILRNAGTGSVTLDPNGAETIDGAASLVLHPGHARLVRCDGAGFHTALIEGRRVLMARDEKPSGTNGGAATAGAYATRALNTVLVNTIAGASLSSNEITLPAGTFMVRASAPAYGVGKSKLRLFNVTAGATALLGGGAFGSTEQNTVILSGTITLSTSSALRLEHRAASSTGAGDFGNQAGFGDVEVYAEITIERIA